MSDFISKYNGYELGDTREDSVSVQSFFVLCTSSCKAEIILDMMDVFFNNGADFVCSIPFFGSSYCTKISTKIFSG